MNFLGNLNRPAMPGFAGGMIPLPNMPGAGMEQLPGFQMPEVAPIAAPPIDMGAPGPAPAPKREGGGLNNVLGIIGDVLLAMGGGQPIYGPQRKKLLDEQKAEQRRARMGSALANYLGNADPALAELAGVMDPDDIVSAYKLKNPAKAETPAMIREAQAYAALPPEQKRVVDHYLKIRNPGMMAPVTLGPNDTIEMPGEKAGDDLPVVSSPEEARRLAPGTRFRRPDGAIGTVPGGAQGNAPAPTFL